MLGSFLHLHRREDNSNSELSFFFSGLSFVVYVEAFEYIPIITEAVGAQIVIHNQTVMPFPGQGAVSVQANSLVNIGLKKVTHCVQNQLQPF